MVIYFDFSGKQLGNEIDSRPSTKWQVTAKTLHYTAQNHTQIRHLEKVHQYRTLKQGPAIVLSLEGKAQDAILELDTAMMPGTDGVYNNRMIKLAIQKR